MSGIVHLKYIRDGKSHDIMLQKRESSEQRAIMINGEWYSLGGDLEEAIFLTSKIQELASHQNISSETLENRLINLGAEKDTIDCPLLQTSLKTKKLQSSHLPSSVPNVDKIKKTQELIDSHYDEGLPGCNLVIMKDGQIVYSYSQGLTDFDKKTKMDIDQRQHFGSVSKQFTAMSILLLAEEGKIDLDEDIHTYIPEFPMCLFEGKQIKITVRNLLEMRSGLPEVLAYAFLSGKKDQDMTAEEKLDPLFKQKTLELAFAPGTDMQYCNTNYYILPEIIHRVSGRTLKEYADQNIFGKLGMEHTSFIDPHQPILEQSMKGYEVTEKGVQECTTRNATWGACGVIGTPRDMVLWDANFTQNQLGKTSSQLIEEFTALPNPALHKNPLEYGKGLNVGTLRNYKIECHSGGIEGFTTEFLRVTSTENPKDHFSFFLATNRDLDPQQTVRHLAHDLAQIWMEEPIFPPEKRPPPPPPLEEQHAPSTKLDLLPYEGVYRCEALGITYSCMADERDGKLGLILKNQEQEIFFLEKHPVDELSFFSRHIPTAEFHFQPGKGFSFTDKSQGIINLSFSKNL